ncbi:MAG: DUF1273 family protein [Clostridia bacterium]|nr:DUF1273 family protein [Clostridia bacterium]
MEKEYLRSCCFTGHRDIPLEKYGEIWSAVEREALKLYEKGVRTFIVGGALGFDMLCGEVILGMKSRIEDVRLVIALPCRNHDVKWSVSDRERMDGLRSYADEVIYVSEKYTKGCMFERNRFMVDRASYCVSYCVKKSGGSFYTVRYAAEEGLTRIEISELIEAEKVPSEQISFFEDE